MREATRSKPMTTTLLSILRLRPSSGVHRGLAISPSGTREVVTSLAVNAASLQSALCSSCSTHMRCYRREIFTLLDLPILYLHAPQTWRPLTTTTTTKPHPCDLDMGYTCLRSRIRCNRCNTTFPGFCSRLERAAARCGNVTCLRP